MEALETIAPPCIDTLTSNPYGLSPAGLRVARDHAAFVLGELLSAGIASDALRPALQAAASTIEPLIAAAADALCAELQAPRAEAEGAAVPQYVAAIEAAASLGQTLKDHFVQSTALTVRCRIRTPCRATKWSCEQPHRPCRAPRKWYWHFFCPCNQ